MTQNAASRELGSAPLGSLLARYSLPAIIGMVTFSLYNVVDSIFIGHGVGPLGISGMAVTFPIMNLCVACNVLVGVGGASVSSILLGQGNKDGAERVLGTVLVLSIMSGLFFGLSCLAFLDDILLRFGASRESLPYAREFMQVTLTGLPISYTLFGLNHVMRATGYPQKALYTALFTVGANIVLAPLFIFVLEWGMRGAALATLLSQTIGLFWVLGHFIVPGSEIRFQAGIYAVRRAIVMPIFSIGMAPFLVNVCASLVVAIINTGLLHHGGDMAVGAYGIINRVLFVAVMIVLGLSQGMQPIVGYNFGAQKLDRVHQTLKYGLIWGTLITTLGMIVGLLAPRMVAGMFTTDPELLALAVDGLRISTMAFPLVGMHIVVSNFFQSIGMAKLSIFLSLTRQMLFLIPCLLILPRLLGLNGIWYSIPVSDSLAFLSAMIVLVRFWRNSGLADPSTTKP